MRRPQYAIAGGAPYRGPTFGGGYDIRIGKDRNTLSYTYFGHSYSVPSGVKDRKTILAGTYKFMPDEVEVFYQWPWRFKPWHMWGLKRRRK